MLVFPRQPSLFTHATLCCDSSCRARTRSHHREDALNSVYALATSYRRANTRGATVIITRRTSIFLALYVFLKIRTTYLLYTHGDDVIFKNRPDRLRPAYVRYFVVPSCITTVCGSRRRKQCVLLLLRPVCHARGVRRMSDSL